MHTVKFILRSDESVFIIIGNCDAITFLKAEVDSPFEDAFKIEFQDNNALYLNSSTWIMCEVW